MHEHNNIPEWNSIHVTECTLQVTVEISLTTTYSEGQPPTRKQILKEPGTRPLHTEGIVNIRHHHYLHFGLVCQ